MSCPGTGVRGYRMVNLPQVLRLQHNNKNAATRCGGRRPRRVPWSPPILRREWRTGAKKKPHRRAGPQGKGENATARTVQPRTVPALGPPDESGPLCLSDEGENDGNPKHDADPYKAKRCNSLSPACLTSQCRSGFVPPTRNPSVSKNSAHDGPPLAHCPRQLSGTSRRWH